jgi:hypothetical protein
VQTVQARILAVEEEDQQITAMEEREDDQAAVAALPKGSIIVPEERKVAMVE